MPSCFSSLGSKYKPLLPKREEEVAAVAVVGFPKREEEVAAGAVVGFPRREEEVVVGLEFRKFDELEEFEESEEFGIDLDGFLTRKRFVVFKTIQSNQAGGTL